MEVVEACLYRPALGFFTAVATTAKRLQSGRLDAYLLLRRKLLFPGNA